MTYYPPWYIPPDYSPPITVPPPDPGTPPGWPGYTPAAPTPTPSPTPSPSPSPTPTPTPSPPATITDSLSPITPAINFPPPSLPIMDQQGNMNGAGYQVLLTLFRRSGGAQNLSGTSTSTDITIGAERPTSGQIDALRQELAALRTELELIRKPDTAGLWSAIQELRTLTA